MATPTNRTPVRIARGTRAEMDEALASNDLELGELVYITDEEQASIIIPDPENPGAPIIEPIGGGVPALKIEQSYITPNVGVGAGDILTGVTPVSGNVTPTYYRHEWYVDGVLQDTNIGTFRAKEGVVTYRGCITDPNHPEEECAEISEEVIVGPANKKNATMFGLRLDKLRWNQRLQRRNASGSGSRNQPFTLSFWSKIPNPQEGSIIFSAHNTGTNGSKIYVDYTGVELVPSSTSTTATRVDLTSYTSTKDWTHYVFSNRGNELQIYVNGELVATENFANNYFTNADTNVEIGRQAWDGSTKSEGYLSDVYFIHGDNYDAETFAGDFDRGWGPHDREVVIENIIRGTEAFNTSWPDETYNKADQWSRHFTFTGGSSTSFTNSKKLFDGTTNNGFQPETNVPATWKIPEVDALQGAVKVRLKWTGSAEIKTGIIINGTNYRDFITENIEENTIEWIDIPEDNLHSFSFEAVSNDTVIMYQIMVGDRELKDAQGFGQNGFFLPFDPSNEGKIYSNSVTTLNGGFKGKSTFIFDGNSDNIFETVEAADDIGGDNGIKVTDIGIKGRHTVRMYGRWATSSNDYNNKNLQSVKINGEPRPEIQASNNRWSAAFVVEDLETIEIFNTLYYSGNNVVFSPCSLGAIEVDGTILLDYSSIGYDSSGNGNHFADVGFVVESNQKSSSFTSYTKGWYGGAQKSNSSPLDYPDFIEAFDGKSDHPGGNYSSVSTAASSSGYYKWVFDDKFWKFEVGHGSSPVESGGHEPGFSINGVSHGNRAYPKGYGHWYNIPSLNFKTLRITLRNDQNSPRGDHIHGIKINGTVVNQLHESRIRSSDMVMDSPMLSYTTLTSGSNGNTHSTEDGAALSYDGDRGVLYYYEVDGGGAAYEGRSSFSSVKDSVYNFGATPFANEYDTTQLWREKLVPSEGSSYSQAAKRAFDGSQVTSAILGPDNCSVVLDHRFTGVTSLEVYLMTKEDVVNADSIKILGTGVRTKTIQNSDKSGWRTIDLSSDIIENLTFEGVGMGVHITAIKVSNKILCDIDSDISKALGHELNSDY